MYNVIYIAHCNLFPILVPVADLQGQFPHFFLTNPYMCKNLEKKITFVDTVEFHSRGPGRKGIPPIREIISGPIGYFSFYFYIGYKRISVYKKNWAGPLKSLGAKFHCTV